MDKAFKTYQVGLWVRAWEDANARYGKWKLSRLCKALDSQRIITNATFESDVGRHIMDCVVKL